jgi:hypothetical protein
MVRCVVRIMKYVYGNDSGGISKKLMFRVLEVFVPFGTNWK